VGSLKCIVLGSRTGSNGKLTLREEVEEPVRAAEAGDSTKAVLIPSENTMLAVVRMDESLSCDTNEGALTTSRVEVSVGSSSVSFLGTRHFAVKKKVLPPVSNLLQ